MLSHYCPFYDFDKNNLIVYFVQECSYNLFVILHIKGLDAKLNISTKLINLPIHLTLSI